MVAAPSAGPGVHVGSIPLGMPVLLGMTRSYGAQPSARYVPGWGKKSPDRSPRSGSLAVRQRTPPPTAAPRLGQKCHHRSLRLATPERLTMVCNQRQSLALPQILTTPLVVVWCTGAQIPGSQRRTRSLLPVSLTSRRTTVSQQEQVLMAISGNPGISNTELRLQTGLYEYAVKAALDLEARG